MRVKGQTGAANTRARITRVLAGARQQDIANRTGVCQATVSRWERGYKIRAKTQELIEGALKTADTTEK